MTILKDPAQSAQNGPRRRQRPRRTSPPAPRRASTPAFGPTARVWICFCSLALLAVPAIAAPASGAPASGAPAPASAPPRGVAARVLSVNDKAVLHFVNENGSQTIEEGTATGTLPGTVRAQLTLVTTVRIKFTLYLHGGSISGQASATLNPGKGAYASFGGSLHVTRGSGHYRHVSGSGGLYGTINRNQSNAATVQVVGHLHI